VGWTAQEARDVSTTRQEIGEQPEVVARLAADLRQLEAMPNIRREVPAIMAKIVVASEP
jgi:hypothetical protein